MIKRGENPSLIPKEESVSTLALNCSNAKMEQQL